ncbi:MAG TPA: hypothetical protein VLF18_19665 [Tahibacter sp.]|uniref:hypothetical protein n=1 Tax=Tahibacter sp. TaxID=2056211 RepID=UPI002CADAEBD|nr:hypothetical protein [Tahibacter sp.]HSX62408.1 hypothetical protein [Tahibacter sp.]
MYRVPDLHRVMNAGRRPRLQRIAAYRRLGYRVIVEGTPDTPLRWKVFRPWLRTVSASGIVATREAAIDAANAWIRHDVETTRAAALAMASAAH